MSKWIIKALRSNIFKFKHKHLVDAELAVLCPPPSPLSPSSGKIYETTENDSSPIYCLWLHITVIFSANEKQCVCVCVCVRARAHTRARVCDGAGGCRFTVEGTTVLELPR